MVQLSAASLGVLSSAPAPAGRPAAPRDERFAAAFDGVAKGPAPRVSAGAARSARQDAAGRGKDAPPAASERRAIAPEPKAPAPRRDERRATADRPAPAIRKSPNSHATAQAAAEPDAASDAGPQPAEIANIASAPKVARGSAAPARGSDTPDDTADQQPQDAGNADAGAPLAVPPAIPLIVVALPLVPFSGAISTAAATPLTGTAGAPPVTVQTAAAATSAAQSGASDPATDAALPVAAVNADGGAAAPADATVLARLAAASQNAAASAPLSAAPAPSITLARLAVGASGAGDQAQLQTAVPPPAAAPALATTQELAATRIGVALPASRAFAGAIAAAGAAQRRALPPGEGGDIGTAAPLSAVVAAVAPLADEPVATLDLRRHDLAQGLADRIEALRDAVDATSTRIRLVPDALGKIDIAVRRDGHTLHVHFAAEAAATRVALAEAQPRLADIAAERGLTLGQTSVGGGGNGERAPAQPPLAVAAPVAAAARAEQSSSDQRLA